MYKKEREIKMKKINIIILGIFLLIISPKNVDAAALGITIKCSNVTAGQNTSCTITGSSAEEITGFDANIGVNGATVTSIKAGNGWASMGGSNNYVAYYAEGAGKVGTFTIATVNLSTSMAGTGTISLSNIHFNDSGGATFSGSNKNSSFSITPAATQAPPTTTVRPTKPPTTKLPPATTTAPATEPVATALKLDSLKVGDFEVLEQEGKYYVTVNYDTENVNVEAFANPNLTIIGGGVRTLAVGKNVVELILRNEINQSSTVQVIITRPEDTNDYSTYLTELKLVDYDFKFNKDILEYTVYIPSTVKEVYVIAKSDNVDVSIMGDGLRSLEKGNNEIYVKVQYGDKAETNYVIHVKRSYSSIIMWGVIALLSGGLIGTIVYFSMKLKKANVTVKEEKAKILAEANRTVAESKSNVTLNGQNVVTPTSAAVSPIKNTVPNVNETKTIEQPSVHVVEKRIPTNPVAVATSTVNQAPVKESTPTQVKLVHTLERQPIKVNRTPIKTNQKQVVINTGKKN